MKIIIVGAGQVGSSLAYNLASEANDITVVDTCKPVLRDLKDRLDLRTVAGRGSYPSVLEEAGAADADMVIAVTNSDETNMVACQIAYTLFHTPTKIARVRSGEYLGHPDLFVQDAMPVDVLISPETVVMHHIENLIRNAGALQVLDFANGSVQMIGVRAHRGAPMVDVQLKDIPDLLPETPIHLAAIFREGESVTLDDNAVIYAEDEVFFIAPPEHTRAVSALLRPVDKPYKRVMIAGGGNIGFALAKTLEKDFQVRLIERNPERCQTLAEDLKHVLVLQGDVADEDLLREENIENTDVYVALTNDDEANILSSMLAKRLGAVKVMSLIAKPSYVGLVESGLIDIAISPQQVTLGALLTHIRRGDVVAVHSLRHGAAEAIEAIAHGDMKTSKVVGRSVADIKLPKGTRIGAIVRGEEVLISSRETIIQADDHVILFVVDKQRIPEVEELFQVGVTFW